MHFKGLESALHCNQRGGMELAIWNKNVYENDAALIDLGLRGHAEVKE